MNRKTNIKPDNGGAGKTYRVVRQLKHDGKRYDIGDEISGSSMNEKIRRHLLDTGVIKGG